MLENKNIQFIFEIFKKEGYNIRVVGGAVRDFLLGKIPNDIDFCVDAEPDKILSVARKYQIQTLPIGLKHGTICFIVEKDFFEITTLRVDTECDGRHAKVEFTNSFEDDARRRDLTINAMMMDSNGTIFDWFGGKEDLESKTIKFVGNSSDRITEDFLRILRFFRFASKFGSDKVNFDLVGKHEIRKHVDGLKTVSRERIWMELSKIFVSDTFPFILDEMERVGIFDVLDIPLFRKTFAVKVQQSDGTAAQVLGVLSALDDNGVETLASNLKLSNTERVEALWFTRNVSMKLAVADAKLFRVNGIELQWVTTMFEALEDEETVSFIKNWPVPKFPVGGNDLIAKGIKPGPAMGKMLLELRTKWVESDFTLSKDELLR